MLQHVKKDYFSWIIIIGILLLLIEISFFNGGLIFSLFIAVGCMYLGRTKYHRFIGKILFWFGVISFTVTIFNMMTFKFFLLAILVHFVIQFAQSKKQPSWIEPQLVEPANYNSEEHVIKRKPLFENFIFNQQKTPEHVFEWNDVNIQGGVGDTVIDLSYTVLPKGETVIFIRQIFGNVQVRIPYELEVSVNHSVLAGMTTIFGQNEPTTFNHSVQMQTGQYEQVEQKVKIFTSMAIGNLEVKRI